MVIAQTDSRKKIPPYITANPTKIKIRANDLILLILLEYFNAIFIPPIHTIPYYIIALKRGNFVTQKLSI